MSWNVVLNKFVEIKNKALETGKDIWAYDSMEQACLKYWVSLLNEGADKEKLEKLIHYLELNEQGDFLLVRYANYTDVLSGEEESMTMDDFWDMDDGFYRECRSVVINIRKDELVLVPFRKFRNLNESEETSYENIAGRIEEASCVEVSNKLDGSMQSARFYDGRIVMAGSQSLNMENSWRLADGFRMLCEKEGYRKMLMEHPDQTFIFEYISQRDAHVVRYDEEGLFLIGIRDVGTGREADYREVLQYASEYDLPTTEVFDKTLDQIIRELDAKKSSEAEGFVLNIDGFKVKIKYNDYVYMHKVLSALSSINLIIQNIAEDRFDDFIARIPNAYRERVMKVARIVYAYKNETEAKVEEAYRKESGKERREFMIWVTGHVDRKIQGFVRCRYLNGKGSFNVLKKNGSGYLKLKDMGVEDYKEIFNDDGEKI